MKIDRDIAPNDRFRGYPIPADIESAAAGDERVIRVVVLRVENAHVLVEDVAPDGRRRDPNEASRRWVDKSLLLNEGEPLFFRDEEVVRAEQNTPCAECGRIYRKHPYSLRERHLDNEGRPFLRVLCDGTLVKL